MIPGDSTNGKKEISIQEIYDKLILFIFNYIYFLHNQCLLFFHQKPKQELKRSIKYLKFH